MNTRLQVEHTVTEEVYNIDIVKEQINISSGKQIALKHEEIKKKGFLIIGLSSNCKTPISNYDEKSPLVLIVGAEDKGISLLTQKKCDYLLTIPLKGKTSSLNASVATAITLYHLTKK